MRTAYIGLGSNLASAAGSPETTLAAAARRLASLGRLVAQSSLYSTEPVGFADQPRFLNSVVALQTDLEPHALLAALLHIEREFGRDRSGSIRNGPRTLDLDLLLFGDLTIREPGLEVPHPRLGERGFVLIPLNEIASNAEDVSRHATVQQLLHDWLSKHPMETDAVLPVQSNLWRPFGDRDAADASRPVARTSDPDGGG
jgi:2-amino-4-hydroxy-6-hydroxymethyldihydropteridine diphosphokinase